MESLSPLIKKYRVQLIDMMALREHAIEMIVMREHYQDFAQALLESGHQITTISWWEHVNGTKFTPKFGIGGVEGQFYSGWFAELRVIDDLPQVIDLATIKQVVENKMFDNKVTFQNMPCLVPAFGVSDGYDKVTKTKKFRVDLSQIKSKEDVMIAFNDGLFGHFGGGLRTWHLDVFNDYFSWYQPESGYVYPYHLTIIGVWKVEQELGKKAWAALNDIIQTAEQEGYTKVRYE